MSKTTTVALPDHHAAFIEGQVAGGHYGSESEVIQAGLRLLEEHEAQLAHLRDALIEGEGSGIVESFDPAAFLAELHAEHAASK